MRYEVYSCRFDIAEHLYTVFDAESDAEAIGRFREIVARPDNAWESMRMIQVIQERKVKSIAVINRMDEVDAKVVIHSKEQ